jgi:ABC-type sugar transport system permease subunit
VNLVTNNDDFRQAIGNTLVLLVVSRGLLIGIALAIAYLFHMLRPRFDHLMRVTFFLPLLVSTVAIAQIFVALFDQQTGLVNYLLSLPIGQQVSIGWLTDEAYGKMVVTFELWWQWIGWTIVVLVASMEAIPIELYNAAQVDGAGKWELFWDIVLPLLRPIMLFITITSIIGGFQMFTEVFALWGRNNPLGTPAGGPNNTAMTTTVFLYGIAFGGGRYGFGAAVSWLMFLMIATFSFANYRLSTREASE